MIAKTVVIIMMILFFISSSQAADPALAGFVKTVKGEACIVREGQTNPAVVGNKIFIRDKLRTGLNGSLGMVFKDDTVMSLGPNSEVLINNFDFSPAENKMAIFTRMLKGTVVYLSGIIAKISPEAVRFETPVANIAVRGTRFAVEVEGDSQITCQ